MQRALSLSKGMAGDGVIRESRPVRKVMSRAKRAEITENFEDAAGSEEAARFDFDAVVDNKVSLNQFSGAPSFALVLTWLLTAAVTERGGHSAHL